MSPVQRKNDAVVQAELLQHGLRRLLTSFSCSS